MKAILVQAIERAPPGDRVVLLQTLARRHAAARDALLAEGPADSRRAKSALTRATQSLAKTKALAKRYGVRLDVIPVEMAEASLTDAQRNAPLVARTDPAGCRRLVDVCLAQPIP